jgi:hypothetical protein
MRLNVLLIAGGETEVNPNAQLGLSRDRASEQARHADAAEITTLIATVTAVTAEIAIFSMKRTEASGRSSAPSDPDKSVACEVRAVEPPLGIKAFRGSGTK